MFLKGMYSLDYNFKVILNDIVKRLHEKKNQEGSEHSKVNPYQYTEH